MERMFLMILSTVLTAAIAWAVDGRPVVCGNAPYAELEQGTVFRLSRSMTFAPGHDERQLFSIPGRGGCQLVLKQGGDDGREIGPFTFLLAEGFELRGPSHERLALECTGDFSVQEIKTGLAPAIEVQVSVLPDDTIQCRTAAS